MDSFIHSLNHSCIRSMDSDVRCRVVPWRNGCWIHSFTPAFVQRTLTNNNVRRRLLPWRNGYWFHSFIQSLMHSFSRPWRTFQGVTTTEPATRWKRWLRWTTAPNTCATVRIETLTAECTRPAQPGLSGKHVQPVRYRLCMLQSVNSCILHRSEDPSVWNLLLLGEFLHRLL